MIAAGLAADDVLVAMTGAGGGEGAEVAVPGLIPGGLPLEGPAPAVTLSAARVVDPGPMPGTA